MEQHKPNNREAAVLLSEFLDLSSTLVALMSAEIKSIKDGKMKKFDFLIRRKAELVEAVAAKSKELEKLLVYLDEENRNLAKESAEMLQKASVENQQALKTEILFRQEIFEIAAEVLDKNIKKIGNYTLQGKMSESLKRTDPPSLALNDLI